MTTLVRSARSVARLGVALSLAFAMAPARAEPVILSSGHVDIFEPEALKRILESRLERAGVEFAFHTTLSHVERDGDGWVLHVLQRGGTAVLRARYLVDATGDADVATRAGAGTTHGRKSDGKTQPLTMVVQLGGVDPEEFGRHVRPLLHGRYLFASDCLGSEIAAARARGEWGIPRKLISMFWSMPWEGRYIWGATAGMLVTFQRIVVR